MDDLSRASGMYVITGGPGFGKSSIIRELGKHGIFTVGESSREIMNKMKTEGMKMPWESGEARFGYQMRVESRRIIDYLLASCERLAFFDRSISDEPPYRIYHGLPVPSSLANACKILRFNGIFIVPPWKEIFINDDKRKEKFQEAVKLGELIAGFYDKLGYDCVEIPKLPIKERADFVLRKILKQ